MRKNVPDLSILRLPLLDKLQHSFMGKWKPRYDCVCVTRRPLSADEWWLLGLVMLRGLRGKVPGFLKLKVFNK